VSDSDRVTGERMNVLSIALAEMCLAHDIDVAEMALMVANMLVSNNVSVMVFVEGLIRAEIAIRSQQGTIVELGRHAAAEIEPIPRAPFNPKLVS
jgi:hypothetical protein